MADFRMPSLGADMDAGTLVEWRVHPGDVVRRGDIVAVVDTEKSAIEVEVFDAGVVEELLVDEGAHVPVGTPLARIRSEAAPPQPSEQAVGRGKPPPPAPPSSAPPAPPGPEARPSPPPTRPARRVQVHSPLLRRMAQERRIDMSTVIGTGPGGVITREDVEGAARAPGRQRVSPYARRLAARAGVDLRGARGTGLDGMIVARDVEALTRRGGGAAASAPSPSRAERLAMQQRVTAALMARSKKEIPHYYLRTDIDLTRALAWLSEHNRALPIKRRLLPSALLLKAAAVAAREVPEVNGHWVDGGFRPSAQVRLGVAISVRGGGLIAPAISDADQQSIDELMASLRDLISAARAGRLRSSQLVDPTITVTNLGDQGADEVFGVIYPPQVALVGFGRITSRPWVLGDSVGVRTGVTATLAGDHRVSDGHRGGRYLAVIDRLLQEPEKL
jgi:pyruvate dehydrogenase E2 component (dihydrolipoamide acetyltransferase)